MSATTYLLAGWLIDGSGGPIREKVLLEIVDGRFAAIEQYVPGGGLDLAQVTDLSHCSILPPLVDSHVHLFMSGAYTAGRFPSTEVFELPFMTNSAEVGARASWDYSSTPKGFARPQTSPLS